MENMNVGRHSHGLFSLHGSLYAIGGNGLDTINDTVEVYDPDSNKWTLLQYELNSYVGGSGAGLIKKYSLKM